MTQQKIQSSQLSASGVTPGSYTTVNVTVDISGRITAISNGSGGGGSAPLSEIVYGSGAGLTSNSSFKFNNTSSSFYVNGPSAVTNNNSSEVLIQTARTSGGGGQASILLSAPDDLNSSAVNITGGQNFNNNSIAGDIVLQGGQGSVTGGSQSSGGNIFLNAGSGDFGGGIQLTAGNGNSQIAGGVTIMAGSSDAAAGNVSIAAGICFTDAALDGSVIIRTKNTNRISFLPSGEFDIGGVGTAGQVLTSNGVGLSPTWQPAGISAPLHQVVYGTGTGVTSSSTLTYDSGPGTLTVSSGPGLVQSSAGQPLTINADTVLNLSIGGTPKLSLGSSGQFIINGSAGTNNQILTSAGPGSSPSWTTFILNSPQASIVVSTLAISTSETYISSYITQQVLSTGDSFRITAYGTCTSTGVSTSTFKIKIGTTHSLSDGNAFIGTITSAGSGTNIPFKLELLFTVRNNTSTGQIETTGCIINNGIIGISTTPTFVFAPTTSGTINFTNSNFFGLSYQSSDANTSCTFQNIVIENIR